MLSFPHLTSWRVVLKDVDTCGFPLFHFLFFFCDPKAQHKVWEIVVSFDDAAEGGEIAPTDDADAKQVQLLREIFWSNKKSAPGGKVELFTR